LSIVIDLTAMGCTSSQANCKSNDRRIHVKHDMPSASPPDEEKMQPAPPNTEDVKKWTLETEPKGEPTVLVTEDDPDPETEQRRLVNMYAGLEKAAIVRVPAAVTLSDTRLDAFQLLDLEPMEEPLVKTKTTQTRQRMMVKVSRNNDETFSMKKMLTCCQEHS